MKMIGEVSKMPYHLRILSRILIIHEISKLSNALRLYYSEMGRQINPTRALTGRYSRISPADFGRSTKISVKYTATGVYDIFPEIGLKEGVNMPFSTIGHARFEP